METETRIGRYTVDRLLARGGMAEVFLARAEGPAGFSKQVVIKRILADYIEDDRFVRMFLDEARLAALLNHPNIVQVFDFGQEDDTYYLAMEYIEGESLRNVIRHSVTDQEPLDPRLAAHMISGACEGLHYAHSLCDPNGASYNVIHRDISPDNLLVSTGGITKVVDFGIAKAAVNNNRTEAGVIKGKYAYMSPELIRGEGIDRAIDVYALGVTLFEMLTGTRPFQADNELQLLTRILSGQPSVPLLELNPKVPPALAQIVAKAMAADRAHRYPDARLLQGALEDFLAQGKPRIAAVDVAQLVTRVQGKRRAQTQGPPSGPKAVPGFPLSGVTKARASSPPPDAATQVGTIPPPRARTRTVPAAKKPLQPVAEQETRVQQVAEEPEIESAPTLALPAEDADEVTTVPGARPRWVVPAIAAAGLLLAAGGGYALLSEPKAPELAARPLVGAEPVRKAPEAAKAPEPASPKAEPAPEPTIAPTVPEVAVAPKAEPSPEPAKVAPKPEPVAPPPAPEPAKVAPKPEPVKVVTPKPEPKPAPEPVKLAKAEVGGPGTLTVRTEPWCEVYLGSKKLGVTPLNRVELPSGTHKLTLRNDQAGIRREVQVQVRPGEEAKQAVVFPMGTLVVRVQPWAEVSLDGRRVGTTPLEAFDVVAGTHEVLLTNAELGKKEKKRVVVVEGKQEIVKAIWE